MKEHKLTSHFLQLWEQNAQQLEEQLPLGTLRQTALERFRQQGFPHKKLEKWRFSNWMGIDNYAWTLNGLDKGTSTYQKPAHPADAYFINGEVLLDEEGQECEMVQLEGGAVRIATLSYARTHWPEKFFNYFNRLNGQKESLYGIFPLNTMFVTRGLWVEVAEGVELSRPLTMVYDVQGVSDGSFLPMRSMWIAGRGSKAEFLLYERNEPTKHHFIHHVHELFMAENAEVQRATLQKYGGKSYIFSAELSAQLAESHYRRHTSTIGSAALRNELHALLQEPGVHTNLSGLYLVGSTEKVENQVFVDHAVPECESFENFVGIAGGTGRGAFTGHILVRKDAQKTQAYQSSRNVVLDDSAWIRTLPFLEIYADDVKCSHGATVGKLDEDIMFYLRSRGVPDREARKMLLTAFAAETVEIDAEAVRNEFIAEIQRKLDELLC